MGNLVLVRHGESRWNLANRFTGWVDVPLSENGIKEAERVAVHCEQFNYSAAFTSVLSRAQETLLIILARQDRTAVFQHKPRVPYSDWIRVSNRVKDDIPVHASIRLNERYYGRLQGMNKDATAKKYGKKKVFSWRRGYADRPPGGETLAETYTRVRPYLSRNILPKVRGGQDVLVVAHGNTLRSIIMHLEDISKDRIPFIDLPEARPLVYGYKDRRFVRVEGEYRFQRPLR